MQIGRYTVTRQFALRAACFAIIAIFVVAMGIYIYDLAKEAYSANEAAKKLYQLTQTQAQDINYLQNQLHISRGDAQALRDQVARAQAGRMMPQTSISVPAPSVPDAARIVSERIERDDKTLPPEALAPSDRTVVAQQPANKDYKVGVYKINLKRNWYAGAGIGCQDGRYYIPVSLQRNYDRSHAIAVQANIDRRGKVCGGQVMWQVGF